MVEEKRNPDHGSILNMEQLVGHRRLLGPDELIVGHFYHLFDKKSRAHDIMKCGIQEGRKYLGDNKHWAHRDNNQAFDRWEKEGLITAIALPVNGHLRFDLEELDAFMAMLKKQSKISMATEILGRLASNS